MNPYLDILAFHFVALCYLLWYIGWRVWRCYEEINISVPYLEEHWEAVQALEARAAAKTMEAKFKLLGVQE